MTSKTPRVFAIGDIHGCHIALDQILDHLPLADDDVIVVLGDVIDRGPGAKQVIERLLELGRQYKLIFIKGNHEELMFESMLAAKRKVRKAWLQYGGREFLDSYGGSFNHVPESHLDFLRSGLDYWESDTEIFVHANVETDVPMDLQAVECLRWSRFLGCEQPHISGKRVICGHTSQQSGKPAVLDGWVCLDTWAYGDGCLTCLDCSTDTIYQARQNGEFLGVQPLSEVSQQ